MFRPLVIVCLLQFPALVADAAPVVREVAIVGSPLVDEMSGLAKSRRFDNVYWAHNDSGDKPRLFPLTAEGRMIFPQWLAGEFYGDEPEAGKKRWPGLEIGVAANIDWEDIAVDDENLYIADMGNNGNSRRDLGIYVLREPNPRAIEQTRVMSFIPVAYPDQSSFPAERWHYDSEALFVDDGKLFVLTKHRQPGKISEWERGTVLYRLDSTRPDRINALRRVDSHDDVSVVTAADISPDGQRLAVLCYLELWVFERPARGDRWLSGKARKLPLKREETGQVEALTWRDNETLLFGNEGRRQWFEVNVEDLPVSP